MENVALTLGLPPELVDELAERVKERLTESPRWRDVEGLAAYLGCGVRHVRYLREKGLPAKRAGKRLLFDLREVDRWLTEELPDV